MQHGILQERQSSFQPGWKNVLCWQNEPVLIQSKFSQTTKNGKPLVNIHQEQSENHIHHTPLQRNELHYSSAYNTYPENDIRVKVESGTIWDLYEVKCSPANGHCLLYSIVTSFNTQLRPSVILTVESLIEQLMHETCQNSVTYKIATNDSEQDLFGNLNQYVTHRDYNSDFCHIVPVILSYALCIRIYIIEQRANQTLQTLHEIGCSDDTKPYIFL